MNVMTDTTVHTRYAPTGGWSRFAAESLLRLDDALERRRSAEQMLHGDELAGARALLSRAIFSLYLDCVDAGVGDDARSLVGDLDIGATAAPEPVPTSLLIA
jgi:hypothetical protein